MQFERPADVKYGLGEKSWQGIDAELTECVGGEGNVSQTAYIVSIQ